MDSQQVTRREFLASSGALAGLASAGLIIQRGFGADSTASAEGGGGVAIVHDPADPLPSAPAVQWAVDQLCEALKARSVGVHRCSRIEESGSEEFCVVIGSFATPLVAAVLGQTGVKAPSATESMALAPGRVDKRPVLVACGSDARGLTYALLEIADRVNYASQPLPALELREPIVEHPANAIRSVARLFASDVEDKPWFQDKSFWRAYLSMLAAQRFNRFSLTLGLGYDFARDIRDAYFHFAYPFLVDVPGYQVRAVGLSDAERDDNLAMLRFISDETVGRGLMFQLGLWTHAYQWTNSPKANFTIEGLDPGNHAPYCRDAISTLLAACPAIGGLTIRTHGESGVSEGSYDFWQTVFDGIANCGRKVEIDLHAKGIDQRMIDLALATGMPVNVSPKFWAEHMGLPYHQASIRELELPPAADRQDQGFFSKSDGSRKFLRYGYGDLFKSDRRHSVTFRIWPGTQRLLLWGDPQMAAAYGRASSFCGSQGMELHEPLSFKGRKGSGLAGGRLAYQDTTLGCGMDWEKYEYTYCLWGRLLYNPDSPPEIWRRLLGKQWGGAAEQAEAALAHASRILPLVTTAHLPSAANNHYWPEMYFNMSIPDASSPQPYSDSPAPKRFSMVSPLDPALFSTVDEFAEGLLSGRPGCKYSPAEVADWLQMLAQTAMNHLAEAEQSAALAENASLRRVDIDVKIQCGLGQFFAHKLRAGVLYALYERSRDRMALEESLKAYRSARDAWSELARRAQGVYVRDVTFGPEKYQRGHWSDRLAAIDKDVDRLAKLLEQMSEEQSRQEKPASSSMDRERIQAAVGAVLTPAPRPSPECQHRPPASFRPGQAVTIDFIVASAAEQARPESVLIHYRRVNQAEAYQVDPMQSKTDRWTATIAPSYSQSPFPLQYFFELRGDQGRSWFYPGFERNLCNQPYFVIRQE